MTALTATANMYEHTQSGSIREQDTAIATAIVHMAADYSNHSVYEQTTASKNRTQQLLDCQQLENRHIRGEGQGQCHC